MNLLDLISIKKEHENELNALTSNLDLHFSNENDLYEILNRIEETLDLLLMLERVITKKYNSVYVSKTESIADIYSYIDGLSRKIDILSVLLINAKKEESVNKLKFAIDYKNILQTIKSYKTLRSSLIKKIRDTCKKVRIKDSF